MLKKYIDIILAVLVMILYVNMSFTNHMNELSEEYIKIKSKAFVDNICVHGYVSLSMYESFQKDMMRMEDVMSIDIIHKKNVYYPEYIDHIFTGNVMNYIEEVYYNEILNRIYEDGRYTFEPNDYINVIIKQRIKAEQSYEINSYGRIRDSFFVTGDF